jgi:hypothetical protein
LFIGHLFIKLLLNFFLHFYFTQIHTKQCK